MEDYRC
jgi:hypothetical protein